MSSQHTINAIWVQDRDLGAEVEVTITFDFYRPQPARRDGPLAGPAEEARVEFVSAKLTEGDINEGDAFDDLRRQSLAQWAEDWLGDNEDEAIGMAYADIFAEDDAREEARNNGRFGVGA